MPRVVTNQLATTPPPPLSMLKKLKYQPGPMPSIIGCSTATATAESRQRVTFPEAAADTPGASRPCSLNGKMLEVVTRNAVYGMTILSSCHSVVPVHEFAVRIAAKNRTEASGEDKSRVSPKDDSYRGQWVRNPE
ncbi:MAG: hypothetical protein Q9224_000145 [Gallowayella concinna]